jgi:chromosome segregation ATPase
MAECVKSGSCGMAKKLIIVALAVISVAIVLKKTDLGSHVKHWWRSTKEDIKDEVSIKWEIDRLKKDVEELSDEDAVLVNQIAKEDIEIKRQEKDLTSLKETQKQHRDLVSQLVAQVKSSAPSKTTTSDEKRLETALERAKNGDKLIAARENVVQSKKDRAAALRQQREELYNTKQELLNQLAEMEAQVVMMQVEQMKSEDPQDKSRVARLRKSIEEVDTRIQVERHKREVRGELAPPERVSTPQTPKKDVVKDALNYLDGEGNNVQPKEKVQK